jgi:cytochrome c peroxidase
MTRSLLLCALLLVGCERARPLPQPRPSTPEPETPVKPLPPHLAWFEMGRVPFAKDTPIVYVHHDGSPEEWARLPAFWNPPAKDKGPVRIKVPIGLDDPTGYLAPANLPTVGKWELGRRLFFDDSWLTDRPGTSCATCHDPKLGFTDGKRQSAWGRNAPTLVNVVYARSLFWDGRATYLEEVVQRVPEDERTGGPHAWAGAIGRLRKNDVLRSKFIEVFGDDIRPNQDAVGQALATYLRTLLAADSMFDRARIAQRAGKAATLTAAHFEPMLDDATMKQLDREKGVKAVVAADLARAVTLFQGKAACASCHPAGNGYFSDSRFYNIGVDAGGELLGDKERIGRFAFAPLGEKSRYTIGAWKTPTLRGLIRTAPYFHNGEERDLVEVVKRHVRSEPAGAPFNYYLDPKLADADGGRRKFDLTDADVLALTTLLRALDGAELDPFVTTPAK